MLHDHILKTIVFIAKGPAYHLEYGKWRLRRWIRENQIYDFRKNKTSIFKKLDLNKLNDVKSSIKKNNINAANKRLYAYFKKREKPVFFFNKSNINGIVAEICEKDKKKTITEANNILKNIFCFRNADSIKFDNKIDWKYKPDGNVDWTWDLNRHTIFETLGRAYLYTKEERYALKFRELLIDWLDNNPAGISQPNWESVFEVAFRINTWLWAFYYFSNSDAFDNETFPDFFEGLMIHGNFLEAHLEFHAPNNHLLLEAKALAMLGLLFPEFKDAANWLKRGLKILYDQIRKQVCSDGVHGERATHYHRVISGELLELFVLLENNNISIPADILNHFYQMVEFELWITKPDGLIPLLGDSALEDTHLRFSAAVGGPAFLIAYDIKSISPPSDEGIIWLLGHERISKYLSSNAKENDKNSRSFPTGGYFVMRNGSGPSALFLSFDCGPFGYKPTPNHGHADALSFELYAYGRTLLIDPGVYSSHLGKDWRNYFRSTRAHNTVVVDEQDQSILFDLHRVYRSAQTTLHQWTSSDYFDFVDGSHHGYERLSDPVTHRRQVLFIKPEYWVVIDFLNCSRRHLFDQYFHMSPGTKTHLDIKTKNLNTGDYNKSGLIIAPLKADNLKADIIIGETSSIQGWVSYFSGEKQPAPVLRYRQESTSPVEFCTVLYPFSANRNVSVKVTPLVVNTNNHKKNLKYFLTSLKIETNRHIDYLIIDRSAANINKYFNGYETNGKLIFIRQQKDSNKIKTVIMRGGNQLLFQGTSLIESKETLDSCIFDIDT